MARAALISVVLLAVTAPLAAHADDGKKVMALSKKGQKLWSKSCRGPFLAACVKVVKVKGRAAGNTGGRCSAGTALRARKRNAARGKAAQKIFSKAMTLYKKLSGKQPANVVEAAAAARFHQAEVLFEANVKLQCPVNLDFGNTTQKRRKRSEKAFAAFLEGKSKTLATARAAYQDVIKMKSPRWSVAAAARMGQLFLHFADELAQASVPRPPVPKSLTGKDAVNEFRKMFVDTFCDTIISKAKPLASKAKEAFETCVNKAGELKVDSDFSAYCADQLKKLP